MNIDKLTSKLCFQKIFQNFKKPNGTYDWVKITSTPDLPIAFIDKYFFQIYHYRLEFFQKLNDYIINKYGNYLNWALLCQTHNIDEELLEKFNKKLNWKILATSQNLSIQFIDKHKDKLDLITLLQNPFFSDQKKDEVRKLFGVDV